MTTYVYDIESYPNYFLCLFKSLGEERYEHFTDQNLGRLIEFLSQSDLTLIGYNNHKFDDVILKLIAGEEASSAQDIFSFVTLLIDGGKPEGILKKALYLGTPWRSIDLFQIMGQGAGSLKVNQVRLKWKNVQELPIPPGTELNADQTQCVFDYCHNDVASTEALYHTMAGAIQTRYEVEGVYPVLKDKAHTMGDAQIAEAVIRSELRKRYAIDCRRAQGQKVEHTFSFNPARRVHKDVCFELEHNKAALSGLRKRKPFNPVEWAVGEKISKQFPLFVGESIRVELGGGGLHVCPAPVICKSTSLVNVDVTSYYPSLLLKFDKPPLGIPRAWIGILNDLTTRRVAAKREGRKAEADVLKIVINSIYGKLGSEYSVNYDKELLLETTLNGQLFLVMLIERVSIAGHKLLAANTDSIAVDAKDGNVDEVISIANQWAQGLGFAIEIERPDICVARDVNNYALHSPDKGWYRKKGIFTRGRGTEPQVIYDAVLAAVEKDTPVGDYILHHGDIFDFLFSGTVKEGSVFYGETSLQHTNRWYRASEGPPLMRYTYEDDGTIIKSKNKVPLSDHCRVVNKLGSEDIPADLNRDYYVEQAKELWHILVEGVSNDDERRALVQKAEAARALGFVAVPKGRWRIGEEKANIPNAFDPDIIARWKDQPLEDEIWKDYQGFGVYTGQVFGIIAIDIDDVEKARASGLYNNLPKKGVVAHHGKGAASSVISGQKRGTVLFRYQGTDIEETTGFFAKHYGFEVLYGRKIAQLAGKHPNGERYTFSGKLVDLPNALGVWLVFELPDVKDDPASASSTPRIEGHSDTLQRLMELINNDDDYQRVGGQVIPKTYRGREFLEGFCIGHPHHPEGGQHMRVYYQQDNRVYVDCFHSGGSCVDIRRQWGLKLTGCLNQSLQSHIQLPVTHQQLEDILAHPADAMFVDIKGAIESPEKYKVVVAPTGSGKSYAIVEHVIQHVLSDTTHKALIIVESKDQMVQIGERFAELLKTEDISTYGIEAIESDESLRIGQNYQAKSEIPENAKVVITHFTYASRWGASSYHYAALKFIDSHTLIFIDEIDSYIDRLHLSFDWGARVKVFSNAGLHDGIRITKCLVSSQAGNCAQCIAQHAFCFHHGLNDHRVPEFKSHFQFNDHVNYTPLPFIDHHDRIEGTVTLKTVEIQYLRQKDEAEMGAINFVTRGGSAVDYEPTIHDMMDSAYWPTIYRHTIRYDEPEGSREISRDELLNRFSRDGKFSLTDLDDETRAQLRFPRKPCNVRTFVGIDRKPLIHMREGASVIGLTATMTQQKMQFLEAMLPGIKRFDISADDERKIDKNILIGTVLEIKAERIAEGLWKTGNHEVLRFKETKAAASEEFKQFSKAGLNVCFSSSMTSHTLASRTDAKVKLKDHRFTLTYSLGSLGRGIDLPAFKVVNINTGIYKPVAAYAFWDTETLERAIQEGRITTTLQNAGRVLRREEGENYAVRGIVLEELTCEEELKLLAAHLQGMSREPIETWWVPPYVDVPALCEYLSVITQTLSLPPELPKDWNGLLEDIQRRVNDKETIGGIKKHIHWSRIKKRIPADVRAQIESIIKVSRRLTEKDIQLRIERYAQEGKTPGVIANLLNVKKMSLEKQSSLKEWIQQACNQYKRDRTAGLNAVGTVPAGPTEHGSAERVIEVGSS